MACTEYVWYVLRRMRCVVGCGLPYYHTGRIFVMLFARAATFGRSHLVCVEHGRAITLAFPLRKDGAALDRPSSALLRDDLLSAVVELVLPLTFESSGALDDH